MERMTKITLKGHIIYVTYEDAINKTVTRVQAGGDLMDILDKLTDKEVNSILRRL